MTALTRDNLVQFVGNLRYRLDLLAQTRKHTDRFLATRFNIFEYIDPDENGLSDVIKDLIDPNGSHGQADAFLAEFLAVMRPLEPGWTFRSIRRETATSFIASTRRRMDVQIDLDSFGIAIENKPWADDQTDQIHDYVTHLDRQYAGNFAIIYLSPDGSEPTSIDEAFRKRLMNEKKLILCAYRGLFHQWLERCYQVCHAEKIRWFLHDFMNYSEQCFASIPTAANSNE